MAWREEANFGVCRAERFHHRDQVVLSTATALSLTIPAHGEKVLRVESNSTVANTFTLPAATGSGTKFTIVNNVVQTQGSVVVAAAGTDVMEGTAFMISDTAGSSDVFRTSATSDKISLNITTTGGLGGDHIECWDIESGVWMVKVVANCTTTAATPFSAT